ncbi:coiled-coil domain-containing protein 137 isoform X2 [Rhineura floridana]|uniref:coiled-coil domain-containing protein 137 isoform X2 n=1 Tax=Rhineura floridana TaxID=261503 RepID=UPI002AC83EBD|nr:coiled-coil domain-containing protein 137 isoform X2 [Rhineura floridana]
MERGGTGSGGSARGCCLPRVAMGRWKQRTPKMPSAVPGDRQTNKKKTKCLDEQEIPFRLREIMKSRDELKNPKSKKKKKKASQQRLEGDIPVPKFKRRKGEAESSYVGRMERETQHVLFLTKNQLQREPEKEEPAPQKSQKKKEFQQKKLDKIRKQKEEKKAAMLEKDFFRDSVKFGEVAVQPPTLTAKPRKSVIKDKDNLHFKSCPSLSCSPEDHAGGKRKGCSSLPGDKET